MTLKRRGIKVIEDEKGNRVPLYICPFQYRRYNPETGKTHKTPTDPYHDDKGKRYCRYKKGNHCKNCMHYNQWKVNNEKFKKIIRRMETTGLAPDFWVNYTPQKLHAHQKMLQPF